MANQKLFSEFPITTTLEWEEKIKTDLKGADYNKKLIWKTREKFNVKPYYRQEDLAVTGIKESFPSGFPYLRGNKNNNHWLIRQDIYVSDIVEANKLSLEILMKGVTSLGYVLSKDLSLKELEILTSNIFADAVELNFINCSDPIALIYSIDSLSKKYNRDLNKIFGSIDFDPLGDSIINGAFIKNNIFDVAKQLINASAHLPNYKILSVNGKHFRNAGSTITEELGFSLAQGVNYLTQLTEKGLSVNEISPRLKFNFAIGSDYFMEIAKLRAARYLWANIVKAYGCADDQFTVMNIHSETTLWNKTAYDVYVNLLRTTTESMSAILAGTDSLTVVPYNTSNDQSTEFSERLARNQQLLLKEESYFDKINDPAAGSYYIENLTAEIAKKSWEIFLNVQEEGGFYESLKKGSVQKTINLTASERELKIAQGQEVLLGTNRFPNKEDVIVQINKTIQPPKVKNEIKTIKLFRGSQKFEKLRIATDQYAKNHDRPSVFLFPLGNLTMSQARVQFSSNFFAVAGFEIIENPMFKSVEDGLKIFNKTKADILVICSADEEYESILVQLKNKLNKDVKLVVAGYPKDYLDSLQKLGAEYFIHLRSNILETLTEFQKIIFLKKKDYESSNHNR